MHIKQLVSVFCLIGVSLVAGDQAIPKTPKVEKAKAPIAVVKRVAKKSTPGSIDTPVGKFQRPPTPVVSKKPEAKTKANIRVVSKKTGKKDNG